jgi:hypothetical protein
METLIDLFELNHRPAIETYRRAYRLASTPLPPDSHDVDAGQDDDTSAHLASADRASALWKRARLWSSED